MLQSTDENSISHAGFLVFSGPFPLSAPFFSAMTVANLTESVYNQQQPLFDDHGTV